MIPTTDWLRHPVPNRLNHIFDRIGREHEIFVAGFYFKKFDGNRMRPCRYGTYPFDWIRPRDISLHYILNAPFVWLKMRKLARDKKIDLIVSANIIPSFFANFMGVPVVMDYLDHFEESGSIYYGKSWIGRVAQRVIRMITRYNLHHASRVVTVTEELKNYLESVGVTCPITVIPNGVDTKTFYPLRYDVPYSDKKILGYVGSIEEWIDLDLVISCLKELDMDLMIVGSSLHTDYHRHLIRTACIYHVEDHLLFMGAYDYNELKSIISYMDIGLNPLRPMLKNDYSAGGKVFNYLACGVPVVSTPVISLQKIVPYGIWYYNSREEFMEQVRTLLHDKPEKSDLVDAAKPFDWDLLARKYQDVLESQHHSL